MPIVGKRPSHRHISNDDYLLEEDLIWRDPSTNILWKVKAPFQWDKGTVMKWLPRMFVPHGDEMTYPSALHDLFYGTHAVERAIADLIFRRFLIEEFERSGDFFGKFKAYTAWAAVRLNLKAAWNWGKEDAKKEDT